MKKIYLIPAMLLLTLGCGRIGGGKFIDPGPMKLLNEEKREVTLSELKGTIVVLEFFGTWCSPCVEEMPHLDELTVELKDEPITFFTVTDEKSATMEEFLKKNPTKTRVGVDAGKWFDAYRIWARPTVLILGRDGRVLGRTFPVELNAEKLREIINTGKTESISPGIFDKRIGPTKTTAHNANAPDSTTDSSDGLE